MNDPNALKELLSSPVALFLLMLFGTLLSMLKQYRDARANGATISLGAYLTQVETAISIGANVLAFIGLIMTDALNWTGAIGLGYALNSVSDMTRTGSGRSAAIIDSIPDSTEAPK